MSTKFIQVMTLDWHLNFSRQGQICVPVHSLRKKMLQIQFLKMSSRPYTQDCDHFNLQILLLLLLLLLLS